MRKGIKTDIPCAKMHNQSELIAVFTKAELYKAFLSKFKLESCSELHAQIETLIRGRWNTFITSNSAGQSAEFESIEVNIIKSKLLDIRKRYIDWESKRIAKEFVY